jgi:hypothetical protein
VNAIYPRCFVETVDGLAFAVVLGGLEDGRVRAELRYRRDGEHWRKLDPAQAQALLSAQAPDWIFHSWELDCRLHGVPVAAIVQVHEPQARLQALLEKTPCDALEQALHDVLGVFAEHGLASANFGVTGSLLIGAQTSTSDIDLLIFERETFETARGTVAAEIGTGRFKALDDKAWRAAYARRGCSLSFAEYLAHERRKFNKFLYGNIKVDLSLAVNSEVQDIAAQVYRKRGRVKLRARVCDASGAFDYPYRYGIEHPDYAEILSFTNTYAGQALAGETVEVVGLVEEGTDGTRRIVVGASREATGDYLKVPALVVDSSVVSHQ